MNAPTPRPTPRDTVRNWTRPESYLGQRTLFSQRTVEEPRRTAKKPRLRSASNPRSNGHRRSWRGWHFVTPLLAMLLVALVWLTVL